MQVSIESIIGKGQHTVGLVAEFKRIEVPHGIRPLLRGGDGVGQVVETTIEADRRGSG